MSGRTIKVLAAAVPAALALAGCGGGPVRAGAAAVVGDDRITVSTLDRAVQDWQREFRADPRANQLRSQSQPMAESELQNALFKLVEIRIVGEAGRRAGVRATDGQVDMVLGAIDRDVRSGPASSFTRAQGLPARYARDVARQIVLQTEIARRYGNDGSRIRPLVMDAARSLDIKINPRYGTFDPGRLAVGPPRTTLSRPESGIG